MKTLQMTATSSLGRVLGPTMAAWLLCTGCSLEAEQPSASGSEEAVSADVKPVHVERLSNGAALTFWSTGAGGPSAVELLAPEGSELGARFTELQGANPIEMYHAFREKEAAPAVLEALAPMTSDWKQSVDPTRIATRVAADPALGAESATPDLIPKNHAQAWFTTNHCDFRAGTALIECLHDGGPTAQTQDHHNGPFGQGTKIDPWLFTGYNDHTGSATFTMNWSGGVFLTAQVPANTLAIRSVNTNGNTVWGRMTGVGQVARMAARASFVIIH